MAESVVAQLPQRFYCHKCSREIDNVSAEYTCPLCAGGFIEELPPNGSERGQSTSTSEDVDMSGEFDNHRLSDRISSLLMSSIGGNLQSYDQENGEPNPDGSTSTGQRGRHTTGRRRNTETPNIENIMQEFLISISGGQNQTPNQMFFMGNPGDYAWGREGLDSVITQMLNQMENSGPPPLAKEKIKEIPIIEITDEHVEQNLQCSVCWDNYERMESARKLPCTHIFHDNCIIPWLELHGTCPVCRKPVEEEPQNPISNRLGNVYRTTFNFFQDNDASALNQSDTDPNLLSFLSHHLTQQTRADPPSSTQSDSSSSTSQRNRRNSSSSDRRDDDGNIEFDCD